MYQFENNLKSLILNKVRQLKAPSRPAAIPNWDACLFTLPSTSSENPDFRFLHHNYYFQKSEQITSKDELFEDNKMATLTLDLPMSQLNVNDNLPSVNFGFADLRDRMSKFTVKFDAFIEREHQRVLDERNQFRKNIADLISKHFSIPSPRSTC
jgi:hypothetical protein